jgi:hypothetical protein
MGYACGSLCVKSLITYLFRAIQGTLARSVDSPRLRYAGRPSLSLREKEGREEIYNQIFYMLHIPLFATGKERVASVAMPGESTEHDS